MTTPQNILVTGVTGYIGGRLAPRLIQKGYNVRCLARDASRLRGRPWQDKAEVVEGDVLKPETLPAALEGIDVAYYLIHSLDASGFAKKDRIAANHFGKAAREAGVQRIIYLGGIQPKTHSLSEHLASRLQTGEYLRKWGVPLTEFRAAAIVGSGSLSFEVIRYLSERLPFMITPRWVWTPTQPIAVRNVLQYLISALETHESTGEIIEIGGADVLTYGDMMRIYAEIRGLKRRFVPVPFLTPYLSSHWVGLVTPLNSKIVRPLVKGLNNELTVQDTKADELFDVPLLTYQEAVEKALDRFKNDNVESTWSDSIASNMGRKMWTEPLVDKEGMIQERRHIRVHASASDVFSALKSQGGENGWYYADFLWKLRGSLDLLMGGVGLRKSRRSYTDLRPGDTLDFWRVEAVEENKLLRLRAEMKVPGKAWLQYELEEVSENETILSQTAFFEPKGISGFLYWYALYLPHIVIFPGMLRGLASKAEALHAKAIPVGKAGGTTESEKEDPYLPDNTYIGANF